MYVRRDSCYRGCIRREIQPRVRTVFSDAYVACTGCALKVFSRLIGLPEIPECCTAYAALRFSELLLGGLLLS